MINLTTFKNDSFFKSGQVYVDTSSGRVGRTHDTSILDISYSPNITSLDYIQEIKDFNHVFGFKDSYGPTSASRSSFKYSLDAAKPEVKRFIIEQWQEVETIMSEYVDKIAYSLLVIQVPGSTVSPHAHRANIKQTITFCFKFDEAAVQDKESGLFVHNKNVEFHSYGNSDKVLIIMNDNPIHSSYSREWRFYWVYDLNEKIDVIKTASLWSSFIIVDNSITNSI